MIYVENKVSDQTVYRFAILGYGHAQFYSDMRSSLFEIYSTYPKID